LNALKRILNSISKDKKRFAVLTALVLLALAIPVLVLLICLSLVTEDAPTPEAPPPPPPIVQVVAAPAFMSVAEEHLVPALEEKLGDTADISLVLPDKEQKNCALTLIFGSADTSPAYRYALYSELGIDGYSVKLTEKSTAVAEFLSASGAIAAADALSECVMAGEKPTLAENCEKAEVLRGKGTEVQHTLTVADKDFSVICLSAPSVDTHTVNAISTLVDAADADLVVFNGDLDCGATSRAELASAWKAISDMLALRSASFIFTLSESETLPDVMLCEVISSMDNCIGGGDGVYTVRHESGEPLTAIIASSNGEEDSTDGVVAAIAELTPFWKSSTGKKFPLLAVFPDAPDGLCRTATALSARGTPTPDASESTAAVLNAALTAGADHLICGGSKNSYGVAEKLLDTLPDGYTAALSPRMALCGAIGYNEEGLGGRFELHNSLRGGVSFVASDDSCAFSYLFAAKYTAEQE
jgi:hypothetical protein